MLKKKIERAGLNEDEIEEIREAFNLFDTENTGKIDPKVYKLILGTKSSNAVIGIRTKKPHNLQHDCRTGL
jgi:Ca2+-binding EF-hand superfamily protein